MKNLTAFPFSIILSLLVLTATSQNECGTSINNNSFSLMDAAYVNDSTIITVGSFGEILKSCDNGSSWKMINSGTGLNLRKMQFVDEQTGYIIEDNNRLLKTEDAGENWFRLGHDIENPSLLNLFFLSADTGFLVGGDGKIFRTLNGGRSFSRVGQYQTYENLSAVFFVNDSVGFICGKYSTVLKTTDLGETWESVYEEASRSIRFMDLHFTSERVGYLLGNDGEIIKTDNGGKSWELISDLSTDYAIRICFVDSLTGYVIGGWTSTAFYKTTDAGQNWEALIPFSSYTLTGIAFDRKGKNGIVVGNAAGYGSSCEPGRVSLSTNDFGGSWEMDNYLNGWIYFYDIKIFENEIGYLVGGRYLSDGTVNKTYDGGITWEQLPFAPPKNIRQCEFVDEDYGLVSADSIYLTKDGGMSWETIPQFSGPNFVGDKLCFLNRDTGFYTRSGDIYKTMDGCLTWDTVHDGIDFFSDIEFANDTVGYAVGFWQSMKSIDGGETWDFIDALSEFMLKTVCALNADTVLVGGNDGQLLKTTDRGLNWTEIESGILRDIVDIDFNNDGIGVAISGSGGTGYMYNSFDEGETWELREKVFDNIHHNSFTSTGKASIVGDRGTFRMEEDNLSPLLPSYIIGDTVVLQDSAYHYLVLVPTEAVNYWQVSGSGFFQDFTDSIVVSWPNTGEYAITLNSENDCGLSPERVLNIRVVDSIAYGIGANAFDEQVFSIYPNPVANTLNVHIISADIGNPHLNIYNYLGQNVKSLAIENKQTQIDVSTLLPGIYFIEMKSDKQRFVRKMLKR